MSDPSPSGRSLIDVQRDAALCDLLAAAEGVLDAWEGGDLAEAVRGLAHDVAEARALIPDHAEQSNAGDTP